MQTFVGMQKGITLLVQTRQNFKSLRLQGMYFQIHPSPQQCTDTVLHSCELTLECNLFATVLEVLQTVDLMSANCNSLLRDVMRQ